MAVNKATSILLLGAIASAGGAAYFTDDYIKGAINTEKERINSQYKPIKVIVATRELHPGDIMNPGNLAIREVPNGFVHSSVYRENAADSLVGRKLIQSVGAGEAILSSFVASRKGGGFSHLVEEGKRALTFPVDIVSSMSGLLRPGDHIDLLFTVQSNNNPVTVPLLKDVNILATGDIIDDNGMLNEMGNYQTITLSVSPLDAAKITHAKEAGTLTVMLRSADKGTGGVEFNERVTTNTLLGNVKKPKSKYRKVDIIIGGKG